MIKKLIDGIKRTKAPIVVGLDPMLSYIPDTIKDEVFREQGETLEAAAEIIYRFNKGIVEATCDIIPAVNLRAGNYLQLRQNLVGVLRPLK